MSDTENMAQADLEMLIEPVEALSELVGEDEAVVLFVFKRNGDAGVVSQLAENLVVAGIMRWLSLRMIEATDGETRGVYRNRVVEHN